MWLYLKDDNFIKIVRILLNIKSNLSVILMGYRGTCKTKLLEIITILYGKGICRLFKLEIYAGRNPEETLFK